MDTATQCNKVQLTAIHYTHQHTNKLPFATPCNTPGSWTPRECQQREQSTGNVRRRMGSRTQYACPSSRAAFQPMCETVHQRVCCSALQCVAQLLRCIRRRGAHNTPALHLRPLPDLCVALCCTVLHCVALCCTVLHCVEPCCTVLRCVAVCCSDFMRMGPFSFAPHLRPLPHICVRLCIRECTAVCCSVLRCVAVYPTEGITHTIRLNINSERFPIYALDGATGSVLQRVAVCCSDFMREGFFSAPLLSLSLSVFTPSYLSLSLSLSRTCLPFLSLSHTHTSKATCTTEPLFHALTHTHISMVRSNTFTHIYTLR